MFDSPELSEPSSEPSEPSSEPSEPSSEPSEPSSEPSSGSVATPMVRFDGVSKRFPGGAVALDEVSFDVPRGQFCAIIGPSGAGKSSLLGLVNGVIDPSAGVVYVDGERVERRTLAGLQRRVGMIHQGLDLVPRLAVLDNVVAGTLPVVSTARVLLRLWPRAYVRRACELLAQVGLDEQHLYRRASTLSGGQRQRVAIARAFMLAPAVVLADEPVASLDPTTSRAVLSLLRDASRDTGATVLCSLHQIELALEFADRVVAIRAGQVVCDGPPDALSPGEIEAVFDHASPQSAVR